MLAKVNKRRTKSSFASLVTYIIDEKKAVFTKTRNVMSLNTATLEMEATARQNYRSTNPRYHFVLTWPECEQPTKEQAIEAAEYTLTALDLEGNQVVISGHGNTKNFHVHVVANRVNPDTGLAISISFDFFRLDKCCREIELLQGWSWGRGVYGIVDIDGQPTIVNTRTSQVCLSQGARTAERRTGMESLQRRVQQEAKPILEMSKCWDDLHKQLAAKGLAYELYGKGSVFKQADGKTCKASRAGRDFGLGSLEKKFGEFQPSAYTLEPTPEETVQNRFRQEQKQRKAESEARRLALQQEKTQALTELRDAQRAERSRLMGMGWVGNGDALCALREVMAEAHKQQQKQLKDKFRGKLKDCKINRHSGNQRLEIAPEFGEYADTGNNF